MLPSLSWTDLTDFQSSSIIVLCFGVGSGGREFDLFFLSGRTDVTDLQQVISDMSEELEDEEESDGFNLLRAFTLTTEERERETGEKGSFMIGALELALALCGPPLRCWSRCCWLGVLTLQIPQTKLPWLAAEANLSFSGFCHFVRGIIIQVLSSLFWQKINSNS